MTAPDYPEMVRAILGENDRPVGIHRLTGTLNRRLTRQWRVTGKQLGQFLRGRPWLRRLPKRRVDWIMRSETFYELREK